MAPDVGSLLWWPARAVLGDGTALAGVLASACCCSPPSSRCSPRASATTPSPRPAPARHRRAARGEQRLSCHLAQAALRRKEWLLLRRDPWLASQTLMQLLYLLPPALLLWRSFEEGGGALNLSCRSW